MNDAAARLAKLRPANPALAIHECSDDRFARYGSIVKGIDPDAYRDAAGNQQPESGVSYVASISELEKLSVTSVIGSRIFGELPVQAGCVRGFNRTLNSLEYHKSIEVNVAVSDMILLLAHTDDIVDDHISYSKVELFYVPVGTAVEIRPTTLHFAPVQVDESGFCTIVILPRGTNLPLDGGMPSSSAEGEGRLLFMKNKWLIASPGSPQAERGGYVGLDGNRIVVNGI
jgi:hypothetical protein